jgi:DNA polymerase III epsilon subunit-like protein
MSTLAFVDFEANGFPEQDTSQVACLHYIHRQIEKNQGTPPEIVMNIIFRSFEPNFAEIQYEIESVESTFSIIWSGRDKTWQTKFVMKALQSMGIDKQWQILTIDNDKYLCDSEDVHFIYTNDQARQRLISQLEEFNCQNETHRSVVLETVYSSTILSCAILTLKEIDGKIEIVQGNGYEDSLSKSASCYYQVYKQNQHYIHSESTQRIHNLTNEWIQQQDKDITDLYKKLYKLCKLNDVKFVAHNKNIDQKYLTYSIQRNLSQMKCKAAIYPEDEVFLKWVDGLAKLEKRFRNDKNWICTLTQARQCHKYKFPKAEHQYEENPEDFSLSTLYEFITNTNIPKKHDALMDVYACATIYYDMHSTKDTAVLKKLITAIIPDEIVCLKPLDFWRYALLDRYTNYLANKSTPAAMTWYNNVKPSREIPANCFIPTTGLWWCLKYDGFYVRLKRDSTGRWQMFSRNGKKYQPPTSFLKKLSTDFPAGVEMEAELVVNTDQRCAHEDRSNAKKRIGPRTKQFKQMNFSSLTSTKNLSAWNGMNLVVFSFLQLNKSFKDSWSECKAILVKSHAEHRHITACSYQRITDTHHAIRNFKYVVQLGCEGIVLRDPEAVYTTNIDENPTRIYKMKQKIVTEEQQIFKQSGAAEWNNYKRKTETQYTVPDFKAKTSDTPKKCTFQQTNIGLVPDHTGQFHAFLKFHESAEGKMNVWDLNEIGNRHTCVATKYDLTFEVHTPTYVQEQEALTVYNKIAIKDSKPFEFIVETVYVFLQFQFTKLLHGIVIKLGLLRFSGKTGQEAKAECFHHKSYSFPRRFQNLDPEEKDLHHTLMGFLQHTPHDNKKFVLVMNNADALKQFKQYTDNLTSTNKNKVFIDTVNRLENNNTSRKQQVEIFFMTKVVKSKKLVEPIISWNSDGTAGRIQEHATNKKILSALVSPALSETEFLEMCETQYNDYVKLQNLWNMTDEDGNSIEVQDDILKRLALPPKPPHWDKKKIYLSLAEDMEPTWTFTATGVSKDFYAFLETLGSDYLRYIKCIYKMLHEYDQQNNKTGIITLYDFTQIFRALRERELSCPPDPEVVTQQPKSDIEMGPEQTMSKFPYRNGTETNLWHAAWRMSFAFFRDRGIRVCTDAPATFQYTGPDLFTQEEEDPLSPPAKRSKTADSEPPEHPEPNFQHVIDLTTSELLMRLKMCSM